MGSSSRRDDRYDEMGSEGGERSEGPGSPETPEEEESSRDAEADGFVVRCLRALDMQVVGACRADERLTPLLKLNASAGIGRGPAEDRLIAQLIQHFEVSEIGLLARCLCAPLVSIRVGKINKRGSLLCPTAARGHLNLNILPTSHLRLSFLSDSGQSQTLNPADLSADVSIRQISSDPSARSFSLQLTHQSHYYWLSERSLSHGTHLLDKMKDLLKNKPSLSDLTGISNSRLESFGAHLQAYLIRESNSGISKSGISDPSSSSPLIIPRPPKIRHSKTPNLRSRSYISFKEGSSSSSLAFKTLNPREKSRKRNNNNEFHNLNLGPLSIPSLPIVSSPLPIPTIPTSQSERDTSSSSDPFALPPDLLPQFSPFDPLTFKFPLPPSDSTNSNPKFKPYYCSCPIGSSLPQSAPLNSLMSATASSSPVPSLSSPVGIPPLPAFSGLISDPIVHLPLMDFARSSGQLAYLVSAGPMISPAGVSVPNMLVPVTESLVEKNARETLRRLLEGESGCVTDRVRGGPWSGCVVDPVRGRPFGIESVMSGIKELGFCSASSSLEGGESSGSEGEEESRNEEENGD
ncbi:hypothetical protein LUZ60_015240 [Juncus effusus]|nr:hypothetical protein LUZ60_015240 [Juncus effusus]